MCTLCRNDFQGTEHVSLPPSPGQERTGASGRPTSGMLCTAIASAMTAPKSVNAEKATCSMLALSLSRSEALLPPEMNPAHQVCQEGTKICQSSWVARVGWRSHHRKSLRHVVQRHGKRHDKSQPQQLSGAQALHLCPQLRRPAPHSTCSSSCLHNGATHPPEAQMGTPLLLHIHPTRSLEGNDCNSAAYDQSGASAALQGFAFCSDQAVHWPLPGRHSVSRASNVDRRSGAHLVAEPCCSDNSPPCCPLAGCAGGFLSCPPRPGLGGGVLLMALLSADMLR